MNSKKGMGMNHHPHHHGHAGGEQAPAGTIYTCPMHPEVRQDHPGNCPKCQMHLVPEDEMRSGHHHAHGHGSDEGHRSPEPVAAPT
ncbi:heavy metal-binding domain-containing protein, partial [Dokdonella sp.]|uniref:heavy metal-binding domain-containing protein n=1 Tax=Dokdonella sp. TaxID=2291710 RepID=UPI0031B88532